MQMKSNTFVFKPATITYDSYNNINKVFRVVKHLNILYIYTVYYILQYLSSVDLYLDLFDSFTSLKTGRRRHKLLLLMKGDISLFQHRNVY